MIHSTLGRYRILGELGRGAMGTVYRAHDPLIDREVAIKTLLPNLPPEVMTEIRERFLREAKSAGRLNHANIVTIFDVGQEGDVAYMAMELLEGRSLQQILSESARLPFQTIASIVAQIADALDRAQQLGIVHRDVKPANIVVSDTGHAKLTDFGVAYVPSSTMTQTGSMIGSPRYMSPEQVLGLPSDPRSDIFSLGVVLYEMLCGSAPFVRPGDTTIFPLMNRIAAEAHPLVTQLDPSIPAGFEVILDKALAKKPEDRFQRAGEMAAALRSLASTMSSGAQPAPADDEKAMPLGSAAPGGRPDFEKTVVLPQTSQATAGRSPEAARKVGEVVLDLDTFSRNFEAEEQARLRAEDELRRQKAEELRRWSEAEVRKREAFERDRNAGMQQSGGANEPAADTGSRRRALELLKGQSTTRPSGNDAAAKKTKADADLDRSMRDALQYLAEVARELNSANPAAGCTYDYIFLGRLPKVTLCNAFVDLRGIKIDGKDRGNKLFFTFRARPEVAANATLRGTDIVRFEEYLRARNIPFEAAIEAKSDFGQATRASFSVSAPLPCEVNIVANYDDYSVEIALANVRHPGQVRCRLGSKKLDDVVDPLVRYILGVDDEFHTLLNPRQA